MREMTMNTAAASDLVRISPNGTKVRTIPATVQHFAPSTPLRVRLRVAAYARVSTDEEEQVELYKKMETLLCDDAANLYIEDMACEVALRSDFAGYQFYPLYVQDMAKIYKVK